MRRAIAIIAVLAAGLLVWFLLKPQGLRLRIQSRILDENRTLLVRLPRDYETSGRPYSVLFILDALDRPSAYGPSFYRVAARVEGMAREGIPPMILVGVVNTVRARDMLPVKTQYEPESGQAAKFLEFFAQELIPHIDAKFRTTGERLLYGRSDSGLFTLYALLEKPDLFSAYIASSPTVGFCPDSVEVKAERLFESHPSLKKNLFIIYGDDDITWAKDFLPDVVELIRDLSPENFRFEAQAVPKGGHIPKSSLDQGLRFVYSGADRRDR